GGASGQKTAKPRWPSPGGVDPAVAQGRVAFLPGETSPHARKGDTSKPAERGVSRCRSSCLAAAKGRTWRKVKRAGVSTAARPQMPEQLELPFESRGEAPRDE